MKSTVAIIMGSKTDLKVMRGASKALREFGVEHKVQIVSAHRTAEEMLDFAKNAHLQGVKVIIAGAGGAAHLPGMVAALTPLPVIGVPVTTTSLKGLDALLSIAQMPKGTPVATVAVDNSYNAGLLAVRILSISDKSLFNKLLKFKLHQKQKVKKMNQKLKKQK